MTDFTKDFDAAVADVAAEQARYTTARATAVQRLSQKLFRVLSEYLPVTDKALERALEGSAMEAEAFIMAIERTGGQLGKSLAANPALLDDAFAGYLEQRHVPRLKQLASQLSKKQGGQSDHFMSGQTLVVADDRLREFDAQAKAQEAKQSAVMAELERDLQSIGSRQYPAKKQR